MADDGLLMNFAIDDAPIDVKPVFKGGRWKDRVRAKKSLALRTQKLQEGPVERVTSNAVPLGPRKALESNDIPRVKRQKLDTPPNRVPKASAANSEVISSLFTFNPASKSTTSLQTEEESSVPIPSNAPLPDGAAQFTSLGVNDTLASHLLTSLKLKSPTAIQKAALSELLKEDGDAFIQAETGSGKTLAYLLPVVQRLMSLKTSRKGEKISRKSGLFVLVLAPTRELARQIDTTLSALLTRLPWLVHGTVTGGATKNHEKARIRKGVNILVATPGRLVDHIDNTESLDLNSVRWLVLDEGDRLVELGFEDDIKRIIGALEKSQAAKSSKSRKSIQQNEGGPIQDKEESVLGLPKERRTILCSATLKMGVQRLGDVSLKDATLIKPENATANSESLAAGENNRQQEQEDGSAHHLHNHGEAEAPFLAPAQLNQSYVIAPAKQRLVTLTAMLKRTFARKGSVMKAIVFLSCADSVDFHFEIFGREEKGAAAPDIAASGSGSTVPAARKVAQKSPKENAVGAKQSDEVSPKRQSPSTKEQITSKQLPTVSSSPTISSPANSTIQLFKLHGSLPQSLRTATLASFSRISGPSILLCTDVASRGLDLPNIDLVIEYDPPFSSDDHLHRVGRTARAGREGRAICFLMPGPEESYVEILRTAAGAGKGNVKGETAEEVLRKGFGPRSGKVDESGKWDERATEWQLEVERWVLDDKRVGEMARKAYVSHVRAYATHVVKERGMFDVKELHLGHLAKAFALREKPRSMGRSAIGGDKGRGKGRRGEKRKVIDRKEGSEGVDKPADAAYEKARPDWRGDLDVSDGKEAARKMRAKMKEHMAGVQEFNIG